MVTHAQAELKIADRLLHEAETARIAAEMEARQAAARTEEAAKFFEVRSEHARQELLACEQRAKAAEERARELEEELNAFRAAVSTLFQDNRGAAHDVAAE
jgi:hypothetical protein